MAPPSSTPPRYVELIRVSGSGQAARDTPADQRGALDHLRLSRPGVLIERIEEGAAGLSGGLPLDKRPDLLRLRDLSEARAYDEIRVRHLDRLTRHTDHLERAYVFSMVARAGAIMVEASGTELDPSTLAGELTWVVKSIASADERVKIRERTLTARQRLAAEGRPQGPPPYGRTFDKATRAWGVQAEEMKVYRRLFAEVLTGKSLNHIRADLAAEGVPSPGTRLRKNKLRCQWRAEYIAKLIRNRGAIGEVAWFGHVIRCPPVVDPETWERACAAIVNPRAGRPPRDPLCALLRGLARCHTCGSTMWVVTTWRPYYVCRYFRTARVKACRAHYPVTAVDALARQAILEWLERDVAPETGKGSTPVDPTGAIKAAEATLRELAAEEMRLLRSARKASAEGVEAALGELAQEREAAKRDLEAAQVLAARPVAAAPALDIKQRTALLQRARKATPAQFRALVTSALRPGDAVILPGPQIEIRASGPRR